MAKGLGLLEQMRDPPGLWRRDPKDAPRPYLPVTIDRRPHPLFGVLMPVTLVLPLVIIGSLALMSPRPGEPALFSVLMATKPQMVVALVGVVVLQTVVMVWFLSRSLRWRTYTVDRMLVSCDSRSLFGHEAWQESLGAYQGVRLLSVGQRGGTLHVVQLVHPQPDRRVPLFVTTDAEAARRQQRDWADALHVQVETS